MKTLTFFHALLISASAAWLSAGCKHTDNEATPQGTCRIEQATSNSTSAYTVTTNQTTYTYGPQGNLLQTVYTQNQKPISGNNPSQTGTTTVTYTYDSEGYLTALTSQNKTTSVFNSTTTTTQISVTSSYLYTNGRLTQINSRRIGAFGVNTNTAELYEYDNSGDLVRKTSQEKYDYDMAVPPNEIPLSPIGPLYIRLYQKNQLIDYLEKSSVSEFRPLTLQNGLVTKLTLPGKQSTFVVAYTYNAQQQLIKTEESINGEVTNTYTQTWSDAKPPESTLPLFKGWPVLTQEYGKSGVLLTKQNSYRNTVSGRTEVFSEQTSAIQTNGQGFVTTNVITVKHPNDASQDYTTTETYTYSGCQ